jgi:uncharacterized protein
MKLDIGAVMQEPGAGLDFSFEKILLDLSDPERGLEFIGPVRFTGRIRHTGRQAELQLHGHLSVRMQADCTRCLAPIDRVVETDVDVIFAADMERFAGADEEEELEPADYPLTLPILSLDEVARDAVLLAVPMRLLCKEDCKGVCPTCGVNRNEADCTCETVDNGGGSPFDILKKLL